MKLIQDEFTDLPVSRQRKKQLRNKRDGKCVYCNESVFTSGLCEKHYARHRENSRKYQGCVKRKKWSQFKDGIKRPTLGNLAYDYKIAGISWKSIGQAFGTTTNSVYGSAQHYATRNNLPWPI